MKILLTKKIYNHDENAENFADIRVRGILFDTEDSDKAPELRAGCYYEIIEYHEEEK